jgi:transcriptional regulator with XRE-family HTH domain
MDDEMRITKWIGRWFKARRKELGLSVVELSNLSGNRTSYIYQLERGDFHPQTNRILGMCEIMGVKYSKFLQDMTKEVESWGM